MDWEPLVARAKQTREHAYAPYSGFKVGAALLLDDGSVSAGCNVENRSYGLTLCAERAAMARAVAEGSRLPRALVVIADADPPAPPCGACLDMLAEFAGPGLPILLANLSGGRRQVRLGDLLPEPFVLPGRRR